MYRLLVVPNGAQTTTTCELQASPAAGESFNLLSPIADEEFADLTMTQP